MSQHHRNLGVPVGASKTDIKRAYRRLAMKLHPDKNPDPKAAELFAKLQDSYDALMNPSSQSSNSREYRTTQRKQKTQAEKAEEARARYKQHMKRQQEQDERYFKKLTAGWRGKYVNIGAKICLVVFVAILWDVVLPTQRISDRVTHLSNKEQDGFRFPRVRTIFTAQYGFNYISDSDYSRMADYPELYIEKTRLLRIPINIIHVVNGTVYTYPVDKHTWAFMPIPLIILMPAVFVLFYKRRTVYFTGAFLASFYIVIPLTMVFLIRDDRWLHLLTLGLI